MKCCFNDECLEKPKWITTRASVISRYRHLDDYHRYCDKHHYFAVHESENLRDLGWESLETPNLHNIIFGKEQNAEST